LHCQHIIRIAANALIINKLFTSWACNGTVQCLKI
jgi:hypothetical protein